MTMKEKVMTSFQVVYGNRKGVYHNSDAAHFQPNSSRLEAQQVRRQINSAHARVGPAQV